MADASRDMVAIGNAIVDVLAQADDSDIDRLALSKGTMTLIDADRAHDLYQAMAPAVESSGGSAANTAAAFASFGGSAAFIGKVRNDQLGSIFRHDITAIGVDFPTAAAEDGPVTARCLIFVTPDAQRTMNTYLGACTGLGPDDVDAATIAAARVTYLEGYLWDPPQAKQAFVKAARMAHAANRKVALTLSDPFCVDRHRDSFLDLINGHVDILFANEDEIRALFRTPDFESAVQRTREVIEVAALTRSEKGSVIVGDGTVQVIDPVPPAAVLDTTGAGDAYAAGFLFGWSRDMPLHTCGRLGGLAASEVIAHIGPRPQSNLAALAAAQVG